MLSPILRTLSVPVPITDNLSDLTFGALYHYQIFATNSAGHAASGDQTFLAAAFPFTVTLNASGLSQTGNATLNGTVFPDGANTTAWFQWGATSNYDPMPLALLPSSAANQNPVPVSNALTGLTPVAVYYFRLVATNSQGGNVGADIPFVVPGMPVVSDESVSGVAVSTATLNASVFPAGADTTTWFQ